MTESFEKWLASKEYKLFRAELPPAHLLRWIDECLAEREQAAYVQGYDAGEGLGYKAGMQEALRLAAKYNAEFFKGDMWRAYHNGDEYTGVDSDMTFLEWAQKQEVSE